MPPGTAAGPVDGEMILKTDNPERSRVEDPGEHPDLKLGRWLKQPPQNTHGSIGTRSPSSSLEASVQGLIINMNRIDYRAWSSVALFALVLTYAGCSTDPPATPPITKSVVAASSAHAPPVPTVIGSRSKPEAVLDALGKPAAVLVITGEQDGYMEPCGCSEDQEGGLIRRYDLVERLHQRNWPTALVDLGSLMKDPSGARGGFEQAKYKFDFAIKAVKLLNYDALAFSAEDLKVGVAEALGLFDNGLGDTTKIVVANVAADRRLCQGISAQRDRPGRPGQAGRHRGDRPRFAREVSTIPTRTTCAQAEDQEPRRSFAGRAVRP